ncbi:MAG: SUMF1/EgtB/PvdO family nonheme iron enzyme [Spirochaetaceae bacterium]|nr:SUMF1/EgtB/PvdO family nonheme iron enzyme [Spirochaetaceae bacterium]
MGSVHTDNSEDKTHEVGTKTDNSLKLYCMSGNVWEWCWDWFGDIDAINPPSGAASVSSRGRCGGSWVNNANFCTVSTRNNNLGFRLVRSAN